MFKIDPDNNPLKIFKTILKDSIEVRDAVQAMLNGFSQIPKFLKW